MDDCMTFLEQLCSENWSGRTWNWFSYFNHIGQNNSRDCMGLSL